METWPNLQFYPPDPPVTMVTRPLKLVTAETKNSLFKPIFFPIFMHVLWYEAFLWPILEQTWAIIIPRCPKSIHEKSTLVHSLNSRSLKVHLVCQHFGIWPKVPFSSLSQHIANTFLNFNTLDIFNVVLYLKIG